MHYFSDVTKDMLLFLTLFTVLLQPFCQVETKQTQGCTAPFLQRARPFVVVWNEPSGVHCDQYGVHLNLTEWGIVANKDDRFFGDQMVIFYGLGDWPYIEKNGTMHNGGIPQLANRGKHFRAVEHYTKQLIPSRDFKGLGVIDMEAWRPFFYHNFDSLVEYEKKSVELVKARYPTWTNKTQIWNEAAKEFEIAARLFMEGTIELSRMLRPLGKWGYFGFPRCYGVSPSGETCSYPGTSTANDKIGWLFKSSTCLFPRIYTNPVSHPAGRAQYVRQQINETLRIQAKFTGLHVPVMPYSNCESGRSFDLFTKEDLLISVKEPADMGASGIVLWGSNSFFKDKQDCLKLKKYVNTVLGPLVKNVTEFTSACSTYLCNGNGRCVRKDYEAMTQHHLYHNNKNDCLKSPTEYDEVSRKMSKKADVFQSAGKRNKFSDKSGYGDVKRYDDYVCRCLEGWTGTHCSQPT